MFAQPYRVISSIVLLFGLGFASSPTSAQTVSTDRKGARASTRAGARLTTEQVASAYGQLPLGFESNQGQADSSVVFIARAGSETILLKNGGADLILPRGGNVKSNAIQEPHFTKLQVTFAATSGPQNISPIDPQPGKSNYLLGNDPALWRTGIASYSRVLYQGVYRGIDVLFYGNRKQLEHDFIVAPGADYRQIALRISGAERIVVDSRGNAVIKVPGGEARMLAPKIYQPHQGNRAAVRGHYVLRGPDLLALEIGTYDRTLPLIVDPVLSYSTYLAGSATESGAGIAVDSQGNAYVTGFTFSTDFPTQNPIEPTCADCPNTPDVFITKLNPSGTGLVYSTFLGGSAYDQPSAIAIDSSGDAIVVGRTSSSDFPTQNPIAAFTWPQSGFITSLTPDGSKFNFSTYFGGSSGSDFVSSVTIGPDGNIYALGQTESADFPVTPPTNVIGPPLGFPQNDAFVAELSPSGALQFATAIGLNPTSFPNSELAANAIAVDSKGDVYLAGGASDGLEVTPGVFQPIYKGPPPFCGGCTNAFIAELNPGGSAFVFATYLGGSQGDQATGLAIDASGDAYVTGNTSSPDFPITPGAFQTQFVSPCCETFVAEMNSTGTALVYSTYLSGTFSFGFGTQATGLALDSQGNSYVTGITSEQDFPLKNPLQTIIPNLPFGNAGYVTELNSNGTALLFSTFFGGSAGTEPAGIALDASANPYITGVTQSVDLPVTPGAFQTSVPTPPPFSQPDHAFVTKFNLSTPAPAVCPPANPPFFVASVGKSSFPSAVTITNCGNATLVISQVSVSGPFSVKRGCPTNVAAGQQCTMLVEFSPTAIGFVAGSLTIFDNAPVQPQAVPLEGFAVAPIVQIFQNPVVLSDLLVGTVGLPTPLFVSNQGTAPLQFSSITESGADFTETNNCSVVQPGSGCIVFITFHALSAGFQSGTITLVDNAPDSPQVVTVQANGLAAYPVPSIFSITPSSVQQGSGSQSLNVFGSGFFASSIIQVNGVNHRTAYQGETSLSTTLSAAEVKQLQNLSVDVLTPVPGGGISNSLPLLVYQDIPLQAKDLVYEPFSRKLYASISSNASTNANTIVAIDPATQALGTPISIGDNPSRLAVSNDGHFLYVGLDGDNAVQQFDLVSQTVGSRVALPVAAPFGFNTVAHDIEVVPGDPNSYVASVFAPFVSPAEAGVVLVSSGTLTSYLPSQTPPNVFADSVGFLSAPNVFYGSNGFDFYDLGISDNTLSVLQTSFFPQNFGQFVSDGSFLYSTLGQVFDPIKNEIVGSYQFQGSGSFNPAVLPESSIGQTYFLTLATTSLVACNQQTFAQAGSVQLPSNFFETSRLTRWGQDGFAFLLFNFATNSSDLILLRSNIALPSAGPNPVPTITSLSPTQGVPGANITLTVTGSNFVPGVVVRWNNSDRTTFFVNSTQVTADISAADVSNAGKVSISVSNPAPGGGVSNTLPFVVKPSLQ